MKRFQNKKQIKQRFYSGITVTALIFVVLLLANGVFKLYLKERDSSKALGESQNKLEELKKRKDGLSSEIQKLSTDEGIEEEIRTKYNVAKPDEKVVFVVQDEEVKEEKDDRGFFEKLWDMVWR